MIRVCRLPPRRCRTDLAGTGPRPDRHGPRVIACHDGDTCTVNRDILPGRDRVRLRNADAPEIKGKCAAEKQMAQQARFFALQLVSKVVTLVKVDKYARRVDAYVTMPDGRDLGRAPIAAGLARPYSGGKRAGWCE